MRGPSLALAIAMLSHRPVAAAPPPDAGPPAVAAAQSQPDGDATTPEGPMVLDGVLPCGLRVLVARDSTLPVAAVVLAIETGTEDDPAGQPGLVRTLAHQLAQGNRELAPGAAAAIVHDAGGAASLAVGPAMVRFESLVPASRANEAVWIEAQRLRAPTVSEVLWKDSLRAAAADGARRWAIPEAVLAAAHDAPGLVPRTETGDPLAAMTPRAIETALAQRFSYASATLAIVTPEDPASAYEAAAHAFADLPPSPRTQRARAGEARPIATTPRELAVPAALAGSYVWAVPAGPTARLSATVWCRTLNRQRRTADEAKRARVRCHLDDDPRRATLWVRVDGTDDGAALLTARLQRIADGTDAGLLAAQRDIVFDTDRLELRTPLSLARRLASAAAGEAAGATAPARRSLASLVGHESIDPRADRFVLPEWLAPSAALRLVAATPAAPTEATP